MPKSRKSPGRRGARTGVETNNVPNGDSIEQWIDSTKSPERRNEAREEEEQQSHEPETPPPKKTAKKKTKTPKENVSMKLSGADEDDGSKDQGDDRRFSSGSSEARDYARKVIRSSRKSDLTSPSELSRVSTAAPSPAPDEDITEDNNENSNNFPADDRHESDIEVENPMLTQEEENEPEVAREEDVAKQAAIKNSAETTEVASPDDDFNMGGNDYESDGADPMLPPTGDDFSDDEDRVPPTDEEAAKKTEEQIDGLEESDNENDANDDFDDEDNEGPGYNMVHDPETPEAVRAARAKREKENLEQRKGRKKKRRSDSDTDATQESSKATPKPKKGKRQKNTKRSVVFSPQGIPIANREYDRIPIGAFIESSPEDGGPRRSKRAKIKPLEFWRGEKMEFGAHDEEGELAEAFGNMPVVKEIQKANPTPYKKKKVPAAAGGKKKKKSNDKGGVDEREEFDSRKLRRKYKYIDGEEAYLWDDSNEDAGDQKVVSYASKMEGSDLPLPPQRKKSEGKVTGKAAQAFNTHYPDEDNYVGYIMGNLVLPPKGIKDSESVGPCSQTFTVCNCQPKALEVAYGDPDNGGNELDPDSAQRFLLSPGDMFRVPPGNSYRLENHSTTTDCLLTWTIIRPKSAQSQD